MNDTLVLILGPATAFLLGSLLGGQILGRMLQVDLRESGSGNIGATNALRARGKGFALGVLLIDLGKGVLAVTLIPTWFPADGALPWLCGLFAILGHIYSPFAGFSGGKGAATALGAALVLLPLGTLLAMLSFALSLVLSGYVGLSMIFAHSILLLHTACFSGAGAWSPAAAYAAIVLGLMIWSHRENLQRLRAGTENRFEKAMLFRRQR